MSFRPTRVWYGMGGAERSGVEWARNDTNRSINVMIKVIAVKPLKNYLLALLFSNKRRARVSVEKMLWGKMFASLKNEKMFNKVTVNNELGTVTWPNGADIAPEALYGKAFSSAVSD